MQQPVQSEFHQAGLSQLLDELKASLSETQRALLTSNLVELERQTSRQRELCETIARSCATRTCQPLPDEEQIAAGACRRAARLQSAILQKLQRGLGLLTLLQASRALTYEQPKQRQAASDHPGE